jgi:hypothetical protein
LERNGLQKHSSLIIQVLFLIAGINNVGLGKNH